MATEAIEKSGTAGGDTTNNSTAQKTVDDSSIRELKELFKLAEEYGFGLASIRRFCGERVGVLHRRRL